MGNILKKYFKGLVVFYAIPCLKVVPEIDVEEKFCLSVEQLS